MSSEVENGLEFEIGHVLFLDIVGYSKLLIDDQYALTRQLNELCECPRHFAALKPPKNSCAFPLATATLSRRSCDCVAFGTSPSPRSSP